LDSLKIGNEVGNQMLGVKTMVELPAFPPFLAGRSNETFNAPFLLVGLYFILSFDSGRAIQRLL
jgi:hypothetical protein